MTPPRPVDQDTVVGIAFHQPNLAPDDLVQGADVTDDVDAFDIDPRTLLNLE